MERIRWIDLNGHRILKLDFSNLLEKKFMLLMEEASEFQIQHGQEEIFVLCDVSNTHTTPNVIKATKNSTEALAKNSIERKLAVIGFNRMQRILARILKNDIYFASSEKDALAWLKKEVVKSQSKVSNP